MKSILIWLFVFTLGSLAANIPTDENNNDVPMSPEDVSAESSEKQSSDPALSSSVRITKRGVGRHNSPVGLYRLNYSPVCFYARGNGFGHVNMPFAGKLSAVMLVHLYGSVTCHRYSPANWSYWGCGGLKDYVNVVITTSRNSILLPRSQFIRYKHQAGKWSKIPGYHGKSRALALSFLSSPYRVYSGQQLRVWYGEDLMNWTEGDNAGRVCCNVYGIFV